MLSLIRYFLMSMGVIFLLILFGLWYVWQANLWNIQMLAPLFVPSELSIVTGTSSISLPDQLTSMWDGEENWTEQFDAETLRCFEELFGTERVQQIQAGDTPTVSEVWQGAVCVQ